ncbi:MAG: MauE/DoxX family redox-associated membrane protein, partial [Candidatus Korobacteraceae bacterium]
VGFAAGLMLSPKLWVSTRFYPLVPVFHWLPHIHFPVDYICYGVLLLLLFAIAFAARPRPYIFTFAGFIAAYSLLDQTRWQPWAYQYWVMLIAIGCFSWKAGDVVGRRDMLNICRLIMGCTYVYSGLQKLNGKFVSEGFPWVLDTLHLPIPIAYLNYIGWIIPFIEVSIGLSLLTRRFRKVGIVNGIVMHLFILFSFGPLGRNWNSVVWPWNVVMIALILILFWNTDVTFGDIVWRNRLLYQKVVLLLFGVLPAFSFIGRWPSDLSLALYTDNLTEANVLVSEQVKRDLPVSVQRYVKSQTGHLVLRVQDWSFGEMNVPPYAEIQSFTSVGSVVCQWSHNSPDILLSGYEKNTLLGPGKEIRDTCFGTLVVHP